LRAGRTGAFSSPGAAHGGFARYNHIPRGTGLIPASIDVLLVKAAGLYPAVVDCVDYVRRTVEKISELALDVEMYALDDIRRIADQHHLDSGERVLRVLYRIGVLMDQCKRMAH
jgi:hypothetical protein